MVCLPSGILLAYLAFRNGFGVGYVSSSVALLAGAVWGAKSFGSLAKAAITHLKRSRLDART
jgi:hypothetical protein